MEKSLRHGRSHGIPGQEKDETIGMILGHPKNMMINVWVFELNRNELNALNIIYIYRIPPIPVLKALGSNLGIN